MKNQKGPEGKNPDPTMDASIANQRPRLGNPLDAPMATIKDSLIGSLLSDRYIVIEKIKGGGMGEIYRAEDSKLGKTVAVKVLPAYFAAQPDVVMRFVQEAKTTPRLDHANIVDVTDLDVTPQGTPYYVMQLLKGMDVADLLIKEGSIPWKRALDITLQVCSAINAAHTYKDVQSGKPAPVIHRDIKPANIFLIELAGNPDFVKLLDFGVAKLYQESERARKERAPTLANMVLGTPAYMSPEQTRGSDVDARTDIYAVSVIMYEMMCGRPPFQDDSPFRIMEMQRENKVVPPTKQIQGLVMPPRLERAIMKGLEKDKEKRFGTIDEMMKELEAIVIEDGDKERALQAAAAVMQTETKPSAAAGEMQQAEIGPAMDGDLHQRSTDAYSIMNARNRSRSMKRMKLAAVGIAAAIAVGAGAITINHLPLHERARQTNVHPVDGGGMDAQDSGKK